MIDFILRPLRRNFGRDKIFFRAIDDMFGFIPNNIELYKLALIHKSASVTLDNGQHINNERLEFLGDAVIESVSSDYLFIEFPDKNEGFLTQMRSKMVSRQTLNAVAKRIGLDDHVITNSSNNASQKHIYGDAFEAMMGAIYLDQGYDFVNRLLINKIFTTYLKVDSLVESETDFKSRLIEWCQKNHHSIRFLTSHDKSYSSSHPFFYSKVLIDNIEAGYGAGESKKEAEQRAAYSVSQGVSDADCTKLMDHLDNLDATTNRQERSNKSAKGEKTKRIEKPEKAEKAEKVEKVEKVDKAEKIDKSAKVEKSDKGDKAAKSEKLETTEKTDNPEKAPTKRKPRTKRAEPKAEAENKVVAESETTTATEVTTEKPQESVVEESQAVVAKPKRTRSRRSKPKTNTEINDSTHTTAAATEESNNTSATEAVAEVATTPSEAAPTKPRRRRSAKKEASDNAATESDRRE